MRRSCARCKMLSGIKSKPEKQAPREGLDHTGPGGHVKNLNSVANYANQRMWHAQKHNQNNMRKYVHTYMCAKGINNM